jgi:long-chain acyl-CoA synthetase
MIIPAYVEKNARLYPDKTAIIFEDTRYSFGELKERVYRLANALVELGVKKGDRVAILQENCIEYLECYLAIGKIGAVAAPLNYRLRGSELAYLLNYTEAGTLIIGGDFVDVITPFRAELKSIENYICFDATSESMINYNELLSRSSTEAPSTEVDFEDLFCLFFTGGTTGTPKGAMLTHRNLHSACVTWIISTGVSFREVGLLVTPLCHVSSAWPLFFDFMLGNTQVILKRFDVDTMLSTIEKERVTHSSWVPYHVDPVLNHPRLKEYDLSSFTLVFEGAAPLTESQVSGLIEQLQCRLHYAGGQTETGLSTSIRMEEHLSGPPGRLISSGREVFGIEIRVVDEQDSDVPVGGVGELCARGEAVMKGYWKMPEETAVALRGGWHHTGDLVRIDEEGYVYYVDRKKDMIKTGGENVYSREVEDTICEHPAVNEVAVIGVPDEKWGEMVKALIVLKAGQAATEDEIISHCKQRLSGFKCPKSVEFYDSLPKTGVGKMAKHIMREKYWQGYERKIH